MGSESCLISIIVPVYNTGEYLRPCLSSLVNQDIDNYEIICIDDGSTDNSYEILTEYSLKYNNIKIISQENKGVSAARNNGIRAAGGEWLWFVDSDDFIPFNCLKYFSTKLETPEIDFVQFDRDMVSSVKPDCFDGDLQRNETKMNSTLECFSVFPTKSYGNSPCVYLFNRRLILSKGIWFDTQMKYAEDTKFIFEYKIHCKKALLIDDIFYYYLQRQTSAMHSIDSQAHYISMRKLVKLYDESAKEITDISLKKFVENQRVSAVKAVLFDLLFNLRDIKLAKEVVSEYEDMGIYPYPMRLPGKNKNKKQFIINCVYNLFSIKKLYFFMLYIYSKIRK